VPALNPFKVLQRHRNFRLFWFGQTLSLIGSWMQVMAQGWLALELTNNAFLVGLVSAAGSLPIVLFSPFAGVLADRYNRLRLVKVCQTLLLVEALLLFGFTYTGSISIGWLLALAFAAGTIGSLEIPSRQSLVIELVGRDDLPVAIALNSSGFNLARIVGPALAALVISRFGIAWAFAFNAFSFVTVLVGLFLVTLPPWQPKSVIIPPLEGIRESVRFMRDTPLVAAMMKMVTVYSILGVPYLTLMPVFARERLGLGADGYGLLLASVGVGGFVGAIAIAASSGRQPGLKALVAASSAFPVLLLAISATREVHVAYLLLFAAGGCMIINGAVSNAVLQHSVPDALRGRIMAAYSFVVVGLAQTVGSFGAGVVARALGVHYAIAFGAAIMLAYGAYVFRRPPFRNPTPAAA
jgi:MFS family permease